ncbi:Nuclease-related domain-containing protein [Lentibacillus persicus]|uniref:Nuclease-related domain-containing protein n=1 Tax=Lentibacillus persicus TaxID=640948 RepID=A0A1I1XS65_9BACI|nr:nuclease-related domain-containing protein [Lentibacillus persicus]SFE10197.1 Nuclease-related domain-containing protein [Lentibacillus persicus]
MFSTTIKYREKSHELLAYEALFRRILEKYRLHEAIVSEYKRVKAGYDGEKNVDYKLSTYPDKDFFIIQGIRLKNPPFPFQIDTLILTTKALYILEIKNQKGTFAYDSEQQQMTQTVDGEVRSFKDPILQAEAQKDHLRGWLARHGIFNMPIETLVVIAYPTTIIKNVRDEPDVYQKIIHNESLHENLDRRHRCYTRDILSFTQLKKICQTLLDEDIPLRTDILAQHGISAQHLIRGIPCRNCGHYPMTRVYKNWKCAKCSAVSKNAHERVILDYFLLHNPTITNKQCRELLQINSRKTAYTLLRSMALNTSGNNKGTIYYSPSVKNFPQNSAIPITFNNAFAKQKLI